MSMAFLPGEGERGLIGIIIIRVAGTGAGCD